MVNSGACNGQPRSEILLDNGEDRVWWIISDIPAYDSFGNIMGAAVTAVGITEQKSGSQDQNTKQDPAGYCLAAITSDHDAADQYHVTCGLVAV